MSRRNARKKDMTCKIVDYPNFGKENAEKIVEDFRTFLLLEQMKAVRRRKVRPVNAWTLGRGP